MSLRTLNTTHMPFMAHAQPVLVPNHAESLLTDLIAYWSMSEVSGNRIDIHGGHNLTDALSIGSAAGKVYALAVDLLNSQKFFSIVDTAFNFGDEDFSICWWSYIDSYSTNYRHLFTHAGGEFTVKGPFNDTWATILEEPAGSIVHTEYDARNKWAFHVLQHDSVGNRHYVSSNDYYHSLAAYAGGITPDAGALVIGYHASGGYDADYLLGPIFIYGRCLNGGEITWLYNNGYGRNYSELKVYEPKAAILYDTFSWSDQASDLANHTIEPNNTPATAWTTVGANEYRLQRGGALGYLTPGIAICDPGKANAVIEADVNIIPDFGTTVDNIFRYTDASNYWYHRLSYTNQTHYLYEVNAGSTTLRASAAQAVVNTNYRIRENFYGSTILCTVNDTNPITYTSTFNATATKAGFRHATGSLSTKTDNFKVW